MEIHERLREAREKRGIERPAAAKALGVPYSTYASHENGSRGFMKEDAIRYASFYGVTLEYLLTGARIGLRKGKPSLSFVGERMPVRGFVQAGVWQEIYRPGTRKTLDISNDLSYAGRPQFALEVHGESMNRQFKAGEFVICVEWDGDPHRDDVVVVERRRHGQFEATIKMIRIISKDRVELWPDSDDPDYQDPYILNREQVKEGEEIAIVAKVIGAYRKIGRT